MYPVCRMISNPGLPRREVRILDTRPARSISRFRIILGLSHVIFRSFKLVCVFLLRISLVVCRVTHIIFADIVTILATAPSYDGVNIFTRRSTTSLAIISINNPSCDPFLYSTPPRRIARSYSFTEYMLPWIWKFRMNHLYVCKKQITTLQCRPILRYLLTAS